MADTLIILPTYNEKGNIASIIDRILLAVPSAHILVVDDSSPDGTADIVRQIEKTNLAVKLLVREKKEGLGRAYLATFMHVLKDQQYDFLVMMDADHSHDPAYLPTMLLRAKDHDVVVGSRYCKGGGTEGWELWRVLLSRFGNLYCRVITGIPVYDATAGFNVLRTSMLRLAPLQGIDLSGYAFQIELKYLLWRHGARITEVPIVFKCRREGESKISNHIIREGLIAPWKMRFKY